MVESFGRPRPREQDVATTPRIAIPVVLVVDQESLAAFAEQIRAAVEQAVRGGFEAAVGVDPDMVVEAAAGTAPSGCDGRPGS